MALLWRICNPFGGMVAWLHPSPVWDGTEQAFGHAANAVLSRGDAPPSEGFWTARPSMSILSVCLKPGYLFEASLTENP
jgi:hypothetical protein